MSNHRLNGEPARGQPPLDTLPSAGRAEVLELLGRACDRAAALLADGGPLRLTVRHGPVRALLAAGEPAAAPFVPTLLQSAIVEALDGKGLRTDALARACEVERSRLFKRGGIKELQERGDVDHHQRIGFFRPDAPPAELSGAV